MADIENLMLIILSVLCTTISWIVTGLCIYNHITNWNAPAHQKIIIQMLALVLVWSLFACVLVIEPMVNFYFLLFLDLFFYLFLVFFFLKEKKNFFLTYFLLLYYIA